MAFTIDGTQLAVGVCARGSPDPRRVRLSVNRLDHSPTKMLVDDHRPHVIDLGSAAEPINDKRVQVPGIHNGDVQQVVIVASDVEEADRFGERKDVLHERIYQMARMRSEADRDERFEVSTKAAQTNFCPKADDDAASPQTANSVQTGRRGKPGYQGKLLERSSSILLQFFQDQAIDSIKVGQARLVSEFYSVHHLRRD
jgi:hypothetical protein